MNVPHPSARIVAVFGAPSPSDGKSAQSILILTKLRVFSEKSGNNCPLSSKKNKTKVHPNPSKVLCKRYSFERALFLVGTDSVVEIEDMKSVGKYSGF